MRKPKSFEKRLSLGTVTIDRKLASTDKFSGSKKVKFSNYDSEKNSNGYLTDSQYESQDSNSPPKLNTFRHRKVSPSYRQSIEEKDFIETISQHVSDDEAKARRISMGALPIGIVNRRDSQLQILTDPESGVSFYFIKTVEIQKFVLIIPCNVNFNIFLNFDRKRLISFRFC